MNKLPLLFLITIIINLKAQPTVGVLTVNEEVSEGYIFFSPFSGTKAYLIDNCGRLINEWERGTNPGLSAYFLESGLMLRTYKLSPIGPFTSASNSGGIELVDWDNNVIWNYDINTSEQLSHHDAVIMPNGNILILVWKLTYREELIKLGRNPEEISSQNYMWSEKILELEPIGTDSANIVWQWHINDHYIQDFDDTKQTFGIVSEHPELFDINQAKLNSGNSNATRDWNHFNAIDYNEDLDQILISVRNSDEIWILDHSTTIQEAATHQGGRYGKGGDILYRWGNASAYKSAPIESQKLWGQHGVHWIDDGLEDSGSILIYNNGNGKPGNDFSQIQILIPPQDSIGFYSLYANEPFGPEEAFSIYGDRQSETFYSAYLSNAQRLTNGNTLINAGSPGRIFEVTPARKIVWEYEIPLFGDFPATQGQVVNNNGNFRAYKYPPSYSGFEGKDLSPGDNIELSALPCPLTTNIDEDFLLDQSLKVININNDLKIEGNIENVRMVSLYDLQGRLVKNFRNISDRLVLDASIYSGLYVVVISSNSGQIYASKIVVN